jgi:hypothetical protein
MQATCKGTAKSGAPCRAPAVTDGWCVAHDPSRVTDLAEWRKRGGVHKANAVRARRRIDPAGSRLDVAADVLETLAKVKAGEMGQGPANAIANLARAYVAVLGDRDVLDELAELRADIAAIKAERLG